jgi:hypothetical protein
MGFGVLAENREHAALIVVGEVEEAIPGQYPIERSAKLERTHIGDMPSTGWEAALAVLNQRRGRIHTVDIEVPLEQVSGHGIARATTDVQDRTARWKQRKKLIQPNALIATARGAIRHVLLGVALVEGNYLIRW